MIPFVSRWLNKRGEAKRIDAALTAMSMKVFVQKRLPSLLDLEAIGVNASGGDGSKDAPVVVHANRSTLGKITQQAWLNEQFGQAPDEWTLLMKVIYGEGDRRFEAVRIQTKDGEDHVLHFDITGWFGLSR
ncbi:MAG: hypothetical protein NTW53_08715 [Burkholderiales bacterium]|nr:hypothetical protein [Burkholderiales bacterium]